MPANAFERPITLVAFDADDTLWHSENQFVDAHARFDELLSPYVDPHAIPDTLLATERRNLALFGYGVKGFTLSLIETAIELTGQRITAAEIEQILQLGKTLLEHPVDLLPGVAEALPAIAGAYRTLIVTKGDLFHQESKIARSGLADVVDGIEILSEKDAAAYRRIFERHGVTAAEVVMIGNSVRSDILPIVSMGGVGVHVPYEFLWDHEGVPDARPETHGYVEVASFAEVPALLGL